MPTTIDLKTFEDLKSTTGADFINELIDAFLADSPQQISEMESALQAGDIERFRRAAHSLKSNAASFGAKKLSALALELEAMARDNNLVIDDRLETLRAAYQQAAGELQTLRS